jgi:hypothetical protein
VIVTVVLTLTAVVLIAKVTTVCPAGTVTEVGTVAAALFVLSVTTVPPGGATTAI